MHLTEELETIQEKIQSLQNADLNRGTSNLNSPNQNRDIKLQNTRQRNEELRILQEREFFIRNQIELENRGANIPETTPTQGNNTLRNLLLLGGLALVLA